MLHRREVIDIVVAGDNDHTAGVLTGGSFDAGTANGKAVDLRGTVLQAPFFQILFDIAVSRLVGNGGDGSRLEHVVPSEQLLRVTMGGGLVLAGEVQVDIRRLVAVEAEEGFERNVMAVPVHLRPAVRTVLWRQVKAGADAAVCDKFAVLALGADIVGRKGIYLGDTCHGCHKGRTDGTTGADLIAVRHAVPYQLLGDDIQHGETVLDDGGKLPVQAFFHQFRHRIAVDLLCLGGGDVHQILLRTVDGGGESAVGERLDFLNLIGNGIGVGDHDLVRLFLAEIGELLQHLLCGAQIQGWLELCIIVSLPCLQDLTVDGIFLVHEVHVAGGTDRNPQLVAQRHNAPVIIPKCLHIGSGAIADHEGVVANGLDFQIVVKLRQLHQFLVGLLLHHRPKQLARLAGAAENQALPMLHQH